MHGRTSRFTSSFVISVVLVMIPLHGAAQAVASDAVGDPWGWGHNYFGSTGADTDLNEVGAPLPVAELTDVTAISGGGYFSLELSVDGTVWAHGDNDSGELGDGTIHDQYTPVQVVGLDDVVAISAGASHSLAVRANGRVWAWGNNEHGQLGDNSTVDRVTAVRVKKLKNAVAVSAGLDHSLALKANGRVVSWGNNLHGQLGDGTTEQRLVPGKVPGLRDVSNISTGGNWDDGSLFPALSFSFAVRTDGTLWSWGNNRYGYLGDGTTTDRYVPTAVTALDGVVAVSAGGSHALAVLSDGTAWAWGDNYYGQLGDGTKGDSRTPQQVPDLTDVTDVSAGYNHSIALRADGTALGWGDNYFGQTGIGDLRVQKVLTPTAVEGLTGVTSIDAGIEHSMAIAAAAG